MFSYILVLISTLCAAGGQIAMKMGMKQVGAINTAAELLNLHTIITVFTTPAVLIGVSSYVISLILWLGALSNMNVSVAYPLLSLAYIITALIAYIFLHEPITLSQILGILLIVVGCFLIIRFKV